ncbi:ATP-binding cassette, subfamily C [Salinihabitans flavidus]|uniref:ATP-binding cassette, subfamily C n=1 Tax=Salinihabitans flavidus TaxID=569882 RepID=A0A1H8RZ02_9RHOB|nr:type I secretion system permease/ATPase [Salinihabitans flavidus]SEO71173.1 ATP-binding cassette, subfamily C [Salinihabitans flavidus]
MQKTMIQSGSDELRAARQESRRLYWAVAVFSFFANLLMLTGPIYMLQIYDRVLGSRSVETLVALTVLVAFLFGIMGLMDYARGRIMARVGARFQTRLDKRVFDAVVRKSAVQKDERAETGLADLESIQRLMSSQALIAVFDIPWTPFFLAAILIFHPWLGYLAITGGAILILVTVINQVTTRRPMARANTVSHQSQMIANQLREEAEMVQSMGMRDAAFQRWQKARDASLKESIHAADLGGTYSSITKTFRLFLQSAILGLGAYLVLQDELTPGAMIAASILLGRALAPIELAIGQWPVVQRAVRGWSNLEILLSEVRPEVERTELPKPESRLDVVQLTVVPPGEAQAALRVLSFSVQPGQALGVIGPSGAGKSTLAKALTGHWRPAGGKVRLAGASLEQYEPEALGHYIGYLPQRVQLFDGTIAENIARLSPDPDPKLIVSAAQKADAHEMILQMPDGYDTQISASSARLSGGQIQRIGLARALYADPILLILDEPNSNLDNSGSEALNAAIRNMKAEGKSVIVMAHRPGAIQECDTLMVLDNGVKVAFGPRDEVLRERVLNAEQIQKSSAPGGVQ